MIQKQALLFSRGGHIDTVNTPPSGWIDARTSHTEEAGVTVRENYAEHSAPFDCITLPASRMIQLYLQ